MPTSPEAPISTRAGRGSVLRLLVAVYLVISLVDRAVLFVWSPPAEGASLMDLPLMLIVGVGFDLIAVAWLVIPATLYSALMPTRVLESRLQKLVTRSFVFLYLGIFLFNAIAGWVFWEEFAARYNFIAVDYLVYTTEVLDNIVESYPMPLILAGLAAATALLYFALRKKLAERLERPVGASRATLVPLLLVPAIAWFFVDGSLSRVSSDRYRNEITKDSIYSLFAAFRSNVLDFEENFAHMDEGEAFATLRASLVDDGLEFVSDDPRDLRRHRASVGEEKRYNVMMIVVESLSAQYMTMFDDDDKDLTPRLDDLAKESLVYSRLFATGSRTVRGLEALSLSVPPTPGRSIVKRLGNEGMDSLGWPFKDRGYDTRFMYGGHGYFDNMNYFFSSNGFDIVDRADLDESEVTFSNAWGVCDQDLFAKALQEGDKSTEAGRPFFNLVMTTSNHRPYTYPEVVPIPSGTGRDGAVQYTDFAIGEFIDKAKQHDWFDNTIFVVVGDHCASSAGKRDITVSKHHIPMILYAPAIIEPGINDRIASQIDFAPTILAQLDFDYTARFFGHDLAGPGLDRAPIGNYQTLGMLEADRLCLLGTKLATESFRVTKDMSLEDAPADQALLNTTIAWYQSASAAYLSGGLKSGREVKATRK